MRRRLAAALAAVTSLEDDDDAFELDVEEFVLDEVCRYTFAKTHPHQKLFNHRTTKKANTQNLI